MERLLEKHFPILSIEQDCILSKMGDITVAYQAILPEIFTLSDRDYEAFHQAWIKAIKTLPKNCILHKQDWFTESSIPATFFLPLNLKTENHPAVCFLPYSAPISFLKN
mgnify:CR=1 FL=1